MPQSSSELQLSEGPSAEWAISWQTKPGEIEMTSHFPDLGENRALVNEFLSRHAIAFAANGACHAQDVVRGHVEMNQGLSSHLDCGFKLWRRYLLHAQGI